MLQVDPYPGKLEGLGGFVLRALRSLGEPPPADARLSVLSPIPVSAGRSFRANATVASLVRRTGWRAVVTAGGKPAALLDLSEKGPTSVRGAGAAWAMAGVLEEAAQSAAAGKGDYKLRFVVFHSLFVTALWLFSRGPLFIPTRIGGKGRPRPRVYSETEFLHLLRRRTQKMHSQGQKGPSRSKSPSRPRLGARRKEPRRGRPA